MGLSSHHFQVPISEGKDTQSVCCKLFGYKAYHSVTAIRYSKKIRWIVVACYMWFLAIILLIPVPGWLFPESDFDTSNWWNVLAVAEMTAYLVHFLGFGLFSILLLWAIDPSRESYQPLVPVISSCYGLTMEFLQLTVSYRTFDMWDILANCVGSLLGWWLIRK